MSRSSFALAWMSLVAIGSVPLGCDDGRLGPPPAARAPAGIGPLENGPSQNAYGHAVGSLDPVHWTDILAGKALFTTTWVAPGRVAEARASRGPASRVREGLGPRFNAVSCESCHFKDGRGRPPAERASGPPLLVRVGLADPEGRAVPDPVYGGQIQDLALSTLTAEATLEIGSREVKGAYPDGTPFTLVAPVVTRITPGLGPLHPEARLSLRAPPSLVGLGLLEAVAESAVLDLADPDDRDGDGISGRPSRAVDPRTGRSTLGRFGWKATQPSVLAQNATALHEDMGITTSLFSDGGAPELDDEGLAQLTRYLRLLAPPARRDIGDPEVRRGEALFLETGCAACHHPRMETAEVADLPELARREIEPYTDLLLHDLGEALSDEAPSGDANERELRTAPLWGLGLLEAVSGEVRLLHDGRARSAEEAILWHGGEAARARDAFMARPAADRRALVRFLGSL